MGKQLETERRPWGQQKQKGKDNNRELRFIWNKTIKMWAGK